MSEIHILIYGLIQGITEFLPVSSSGHLELLPYFCKIQDPGVWFDLMMHVGTALAVAIYFFKDLKKLFVETLSLLLRKKTVKEVPYVFNFCISTFVTVILATLLKRYALEWRSPLFIGSNLIIFGFLLAISDRSGKSDRTLVKKADLKGALIIGAAQVLAIFPGVSRSGITITAGRFMTMSKEEASRYSFLLSFPLIIGASILKVPSLVNGESSFSWGACLLGISISFIVGILTIHFFLKLISKIGLSWFFLYRLILGILLLVLFWN